MARTLNPAAQVSKIIRAELKAAGIPATVRSKSYSMGNSVTVTLTDDPMPATVKAVTQELRKYQLGRFDAMTDMYEDSNRRTDIPQTKYLTINVEYSDELYQRAWDFLRNRIAGWENCSAFYSELTWRDQNKDTGQCAQQEVAEVLTGRLDERLPAGKQFWTAAKPRIKAAA